MRGRYSAAFLAVATIMVVLTGLACGSGSNGDAGGVLTVSAASSLKAAFLELGTMFEREQGATVTFNFDASGRLEKQIEGGAPVDVFASAAPAQVNTLVAKELVDKSTVASFAGNEIALVVPVDSELAITSFESLAATYVRRVATGDPATSPHGKAALEVLTTLGLLGVVQPKIIHAQNASQTLDYVERGEVDAGLIFANEAQGDARVRVVAESDPSWHSPIDYVIAVVASAKKKMLAQAFVDLVTSPQGQGILAKYGFLPAPTP
jgi:molybdate transport system substrate-binding protein